MTLKIRLATPEEQAAAKAAAPTKEQWAQAQAAVNKREAERAKKLFGDQKPFPVPDTDY